MSLGDSFSDFIQVDSKRSKIQSSTPDTQVLDYSGPVLFVLIIISFFFILATLIRLQIFQGAYYKNLSANNRVRQVIIHAPRGSIYDRNGILLAGSEGAYRFSFCDKEKKCSARILSRRQSLEIETAGLKDGENLELDSQRFYPEGEAFGSVLGYISQTSKEELAKMPNYNLGDRIGRGGLEEQYEKTLRGIDGKELIEVDAVGKKIRSLGRVEPKSGQDLHLSLDANLQKASYLAMDGRKGAIVVSNPNDGSVLALVSSPSFDPNVFTLLTLDPKERDEKIRKIFTNADQPLFDRAISATYPPGSTFKIVSAIAGLETGKVDSKFTIEDTGILIIGPYKFPNWKYLKDGGTQGVLNVVGALQKSNDIFFYKIGGLVGDEDLFAWAKKLGLNKKTGIDLPGESAGLIPDKEWRNKNDRTWYLGDTYHSAIGQGDILVTPLQDNVWTNVIANGGRLCQPHISDLSSLSGLCKDLGLAKTTIDLVRKGLVAACSSGGTAYPLFDFKIKDNQIQVACKTGTAEFGDPSEKKTHAWLTSYAPSDKPEIAVTAIVEGAGEGSDIAAPVVKEIMEEWFGR